MKADRLTYTHRPRPASENSHGLGALVLFVTMHVTGDDYSRPTAGWRNWIKAGVAPAFLGAIFDLVPAPPL